MAEWEYRVFWDEAINQLRQELGERESTIWLSNLEYIGATESKISISVPSVFFLEIFKTKYHKRLEDKFRELTGMNISVVLEVIQKEFTPENQDEENSGEAEIPAVSQTAGRAARSSKEATQGKPAAKGKHPQLREEFTFDKYVIGENNNFAANAALAIARNPGSAYNPFLIYGGVGMGKTHLMQAIGNYIYANSDSKIIFITAEDFLNDYISSMPVTGGPNKMAAFRNKYRYTDVLLIDDIHFFQGKPGVQEEMFYTFNALMDQKKQIAFTCDRPASDLKSMNERLKNRFESCLNVDLQPPNYETRCAIIRSTIKYRGIPVPDEAIDLIAKNISSNVRDLISALNKLFAYVELVKEPISLENTQKVLVEFFSPARQANMSIEQVQKVVAEFFHLSYIDLKAKKKTKNIVFPRQIAMYLARDMTGYSLTEIGEAFGGRDHATVIHSCDKIENQLRTDPNLEPTLQNLQRLIRESGIKS
ncbi:MAG: chromosomal replication initiator protein DnaA [Treponema sp.]|nr:chromosomal replication initiator protein DnaA [Treponema sp.]